MGERSIRCARTIRRWTRAAAIVAAVAPLPILAAGAEPRAEAGAASRLPDRKSCAGCNLVLVSLDTLRPDRLEPYGYDRPTSPVLSGLARRGLLFEHAYSSSAATAEAHMSLFTSLYPSVHGVGTVIDDRPEALPAGVPTLAQILGERDYATGGFHDGGHVAPELGFDRGFDRYEHAAFMHGHGFGRTLAWLAEPRSGPVFAFLHTYHVHDPYTPQAQALRQLGIAAEDAPPRNWEELKTLAEERCVAQGCDTVRREMYHAFWEQVDLANPEEVRRVSSLYDAEIREVDQGLVRILKAVQRLPGDTLLVVLSDHGEAFMEHGHVTHSRLYEEVVRVPLLVVHPRAPGMQGLRASGRVSLVDMAPTLLDWLGVDAPEGFQGRSLAGTPVRAAPTATSVLAELPVRKQMALIQGTRKILLEAEGDASPDPVRALLSRVAGEQGVPEAQRFRRVRLFDLATDPAEQRDLGPGHPAFEPMLRAALARMAENRAHREQLSLEATPASLSDETRERLEALGYLQ